MSEKKQLIIPRTLKGFRDYLPETMIPRERLMEIAQQVYRSYGFVPIDTPALEYYEILSGKGSDETDKQLYKFEDHGGRMVGLRFDLTVPFARFSAQYIGQIGTPFKRYHIGKVWRGENTQAGRYREFLQCDFDTIGTESIVSDIETTLVIHDLLNAIGFESGYKIHINNRMVLSGLLEKLGLLEKNAPILRALDKLKKIGRANVAAEMVAVADITEQQADFVLQLAELKGTSDHILTSLSAMVSGNAIGEEGVEKLQTVIKNVQATGISENVVEIDVSIARGLDYYTGTIYETFLKELPSIGSVCSGGRYDNLAGLYTKQKLPGIGASLGLDRLLAAMEELGKIEKTATTAEVFIPYFEEKRLSDYLKLATELRKSGIRVEIYPEVKKLGQQLKYADKRGFLYVIIIGSEEFDQEICQLKNMKTGETQNCRIYEIGNFLKGNALL
ncbi:MAG: histidine--tRNA ligase [Planctomycetaceae bacterium]|jgi:histidyl-tRNA synthetase|nr:histidine--tRNA ligase [Planctomycetaceae bacterium]